MATRGDGIPGVRTDVLYIEMQKDGERYIILYEDSDQKVAEALKQLGRWAANAELSFSWYDAAVMGQKIRQQLARKGDRGQQL